METSAKNIKEIAQDFLDLITAGNIRDAFRLYIADGFRHHNIFFKGDRNALLVAMEENQVQFPHKIAKVLHTLQDGQLVAVHLHVRMSADDPTGSAIVHIFRFEKDKIIEAWDVAQQVPEKSVNENGMF